MRKNTNLHSAKKEKNNEFYTQLSDIEKELKNYKKHFKDKVVFCNCDDPQESNFWKYFSNNFDKLGLKKLISTHYETDKPSYKQEIIRGVDLNADGKFDNQDPTPTPLKQNGDFRSPECIEILKEADIVVTNPPFSLFREYISQLMEYEKKFLVIGSMNAITYKEIFSLIRDNKLWLGTGNNLSMVFGTPYENELSANIAFCNQKGYTGKNYIKVPAINWYTNLKHKKRKEKLLLYATYNEADYPKYDNYNAIEVSKVKEIPQDYQGVMGVPITFLGSYNPEQFEIVDINPHFFSIVEQGLPKPKQLSIPGQKDPYARILIKRKK